jgi:hypothetical protein
MVSTSSYINEALLCPSYIYLSTLYSSKTNHLNILFSLLSTVLPFLNNLIIRSLVLIRLSLLMIIINIICECWASKNEGLDLFYFFLEVVDLVL